ncbi:cytokinesis protein Cyk3 [Schizosaccharomyces japonicus yFS275]|uniref:Cytokinesis protein Cyk3 n=1 Tax=Schizosaccharomyces japonicus (strain yFS275 / FY16936) TaxID=402676 RepID=B6K430_SCHJY|nr:cytokinesis protein Cyk3 [Schizosaccharomyces japonicus yFS275]EEB08237.2 cytokinesis protein Cyk3 [Schizosaccharomyces japonicus yFS275]
MQNLRPLPCIVRALYEWRGERSGDLSLNEGDLVECLSYGDGKWWIGRSLDGNSQGLFPSNFVDFVDTKGSSPQMIPNEIPRKSPISGSSPSYGRSRRNSSARPSSRADSTYSLSTSPLTSSATGPISSPMKLSQGSFQSGLQQSSRNSFSDSRHLLPTNSNASIMNKSRSRHSSRAPSPAFVNSSVDRAKLSPSPMQSAMEDVMSSLNKMHVRRKSAASSILGADARSVITADVASIMSRTPSPRPVSPSIPNATVSWQKNASTTSVRQTSNKPPPLPTKAATTVAALAAATAAAVPSPVQPISVARMNTRTSQKSMARSSAEFVPHHRRFQSAPAPIPKPVSTFVPLSRVETNISSLSPPAHGSNQRPSSSQSFRKRSTGFFKQAFRKLLGRHSSKRIATFSSSNSDPALGSSRAAIVEKANQSTTPIPSHTLEAARRDLQRVATYQSDELSKKRQFVVETLRMPSYQPFRVLNNCAGNVLVDGEAIAFSHGLDTRNMNFSLVDKQARSVQISDSFVSIKNLTRTYLCNGLDNPIFKMRAIFIFVAERIEMEEPNNSFLPVRSSKQVLEECRGSPSEIALLVKDMCNCVDIWCETVHGFLKSPDNPYYAKVTSINHTWNVVTVDEEVRLIDACLANPMHPHSVLSTQNADDFYFLMKPHESIHLHVPENPDQQFLEPDILAPIAMSLPYVSSVYFTLGLQLSRYDTSLLHLYGLRCLQLDMQIPPDVECVADVDSSINFSRTKEADAGSKYALTQSYYLNSSTRMVRIKAVMPSNCKNAVLRIYAGRKGATNTTKANAYPMAVSIPFFHTGENSPFEFVTRHPVLHAPPVDLYIVTPQSGWLYVGAEYTFRIKTHAANNAQVPAEVRLAVQTPTGRIVRLHSENGYEQNKQLYFTLRISETGEYRALVLGEKIGRWIVFATWKAI